jgi:hypothetical protein
VRMGEPILGVALWVDQEVHVAESRRFDSYVMKRPGPGDCKFFTGAIGIGGHGSN